MISRLYFTDYEMSQELFYGVSKNFKMSISISIKILNRSTFTYETTEFEFSWLSGKN